MHIIFPNIDRAKKSAKVLASVSGAIPLNVAQRAVARISGCRDWHDLENRIKRFDGSRTNEASKSSDLDLRDISNLVLQIADELKVDWSLALYAISIAHFPGLRLESLGDYEQIWLSLMIRVCGFSGQRKTSGSIVKMKVNGRIGQSGYLLAYGRPTYLVTNASVEACVADFEVSFPRQPVASFVPARLKYAYGCWLERDGAKVLFSRDYKPMWRLRKGHRPERLVPWLWIDKTEEQHFWGDENPPWYSKKRQEEEDMRLREFGIVALPKLTDILPDVISNSGLGNVSDAVGVMAKREDLDLTETFYGVLKIPRSLEERKPV